MKMGKNLGIIILPNPPIPSSSRMCPFKPYVALLDIVVLPVFTIQHTYKVCRCTIQHTIYPHCLLFEALIHLKIGFPLYYYTMTDSWCI